MIFSGLPEPGKSRPAEAAGSHLGTPDFAKDWLAATLLWSELMPSNPDKPIGFAVYHLLPVLAERQLVVGQSAILDRVAAARVFGICGDIWLRRTGQNGA